MDHPRSARARVIAEVEPVELDKALERLEWDHAGGRPEVPPRSLIVVMPPPPLQLTSDSLQQSASWS